MAKKKRNMNALMMDVAKAAGGGIIAEIGTDWIASNSPEIIEKNPQMTEIIPIAAGVGLLYMAGDEWAPAAYGMIGSGASGFADDIMGGMQGFSRVRMQGQAKHDEMNAGLKMIEEMQGIAFPIEDQTHEEYVDENGM